MSNYLEYVRDEISFGKETTVKNGYIIIGECNGCAKCKKICPQICIEIVNDKAVINQNNCLHCGSCFNICINNSIRRFK